MKENILILGQVILGYLILDMFMFMAWIYSNQLPVDGFYLGNITANILKIII